MIQVHTSSCMMCGESSIVEVEEEAFKRWQSGTLIQVAFPTLSAGTRELLMTGTHPECWDKMFEGYRKHD